MVTPPNWIKADFDLRLETDTPNEHLSFYGDWTSYTSGTNIQFYKNWDKHQANELKDAESEKNKPITWFPHTEFKDDGSIPEANGASTEYGYIDTRGALYQYAILAIGIMLENLMPGKAFLTAPEQDLENIEKVVEWLEAHFQENFELPVYFDKKRLLASFIHEYDDKKQVVCRMEHLYRKQFKRNMEFAVEHIGYEPAFAFYAEVLADCWFGTFGFSDVMDPWIAVTQDLESTLRLIAASKRLLLEKGERKEAAKYDLTIILSGLLNDYVLWTPLQREQLAYFYTNKQALETGHEDLFGAIMRIGGHRIDICPIVATRDELFEAFMYHDPKNGAVFKKIIDEWIEKNAGAFENLKQKMDDLEKENTNSPVLDDDDDDENEDEEEDDDSPITSIQQAAFILQYPEHERFFISAALSANPCLAYLEQALENMHKSLRVLTQAEEHREYVRLIQSESSEEKKKRIRSTVKEKRRIITTCPDFERWIREEEDSSVLFFIRLLLSLKIYDRARAYARYRILWERSYWDVWRNCAI